ncbi:hypothetical protein FOZ63_018726, partial [Perkinsus olseni]
ALREHYYLLTISTISHRKTSPRSSQIAKDLTQEYQAMLVDFGSRTAEKAGGGGDRQPCCQQAHNKALSTKATPASQTGLNKQAAGEQIRDISADRTTRPVPSASNVDFVSGTGCLLWTRN